MPTDCTNATYGCGRYDDSKNQENSDDYCALDEECHGPGKAVKLAS